MKNRSILRTSLIMSVAFILLLCPVKLVSASDGDVWTTKASMSTPRHGFQTEVINGKIYAIGGHSGTSYLSSVEEYDPATNTWTTKASMSTPRYYFQTEVINGKVYAIGGRDAASYLSSVEEYDPATNTWTTKASMSALRYYFQTEIINGKIYAIGGRDGTEHLSSVEEYDPATNTWTTKASMSTPRYYFQTEVINGKIYAIGGRDGASYSSSIEEYDPATNTWTTKASMFTPRYIHQTEVINGKIYTIGGCNGTEHLSSVEEYDPAINTWKIKASMSTPRYYFQTEVINGKIYAIGGYNGGTGYLSSAEEYDPAINTWTTKASMSTPRGQYQTEAINGKIYAIGGHSGTSYLSSVEEYTLPIEIPSLPTNLTATPSDSSATLSWDAVTDADSYNIKRSTTPGGPYTTIATDVTDTTYTDADLANSITYYYIITAVNSSGESEPSNEVSATPTAPATSDVTLDITSVDKAKIGDEITADIAIHNSDTICAEDIRITYDTDLLEYLGAEAADGMKIYKEDNPGNGTNRYITASLGKDNAANGDKVLLKLKFRAKAAGEAKVDIVKGRIADNATLEEDITEENCGEKIIVIEGSGDINRTGEFTLLDLGIAAWYYGDPASETDTTKYDVDVVADGIIDDNDLAEAVAQMLENSNYPANN